MNPQEITKHLKCCQIGEILPNHVTLTGYNKQEKQTIDN